MRALSARLRGLVPALALLALVPAPARAATPASCLLPVTAPKPATSAPPLRFGIYPGGTAGSVAGKPDARPEDAGARLARLEQLRGSRALGVHLYTAYTGDARADAGTSVWLDGEIAAYTAAGTDVELVVRYKPVGGSDVSGYAAFLRETVRRYGANPAFTSLQVTNEANLGGQPDASDGAFAGAVDALVEGVVAAKDEVRRSGHDQVRIGFNWASDARPAQSTDFFAALGRRGGAAFAGAVDWVGVDTYPGTFFPEIAVTALLPGLTGTSVTRALANLRSCLMPTAGLGAGVPIHVSENGFPTGPGRSYAMQAAVLRAMVSAVDADRATYNVSDYNWFDLRDSRTDDASVESQYGLTQDDYTPKPAFGAYRDLIAALSVPGRPVAAPDRDPAPARTCAPSPVTVTLPALAGARLRVLRVIRGTRTVRRMGPRRTIPRRVKVRLAPGTARLTVRLSVRRGGRGQTRTVRRTVLVCGRSRS